MTGEDHAPTAWSSRRGRVLAALALGLAACAALAVRSPLEPGDPLRGTLAVLPLVVALFAAIDPALPRWSRIGAGEWAGYVLLAAAMSSSPRLGLDASDRLLMAAWAVVVGYRASRVLVGLRRPLGARLTADRPPLELFLLPLAVYLAILPWSTERRPPDGDEPWNLLIAHSVAYDLDTDLANNYAQRDSLRFLDRGLEPQPGDPVDEDGAVYSRHNPAFPVALAPFYRVGGKVGALVAVALLSAALAWLSFRLLARWWPGEGAAVLLQWGVLALLPPLLLYSHQVWVEVPAAMLMALAYDRLLALERREAGRGAWIVFAASLALLPLIKLRFGVLSGSLLALAFLRLPRSRRRLVQISAGFGLAAAAYLFANARQFGHALRIHSADELLLFRIPLRDYLAHGTGLFFDHSFGLFACAPLWLLIVPGAVAAWRRRRKLVIDLAVLVLPYFVLVASRREWYGGWSPPFRYLLALLPLIVLLGVPAFAARNRPRARLLIAPLAVATGLLALVFVVEPGWTYSFADGRSRLVDLISARVGADVAQLLPSATRVRAATWAWPLAVVPVVLVLWPWRSGRRRWTPAAGLLGIALALGGMVALPWAARARPTARLEVESPHVRKSGGHPDPDPWMFDRRRFPESWALREGESLAAPVRAGGARATLVIHGRFIRNRPVGLDLEVLCGDRPLATLRWEEHDRWTARELGPFAWTAGEPLVLRVPPPRGPGEPGLVNGVILDRVDFRWSGSGPGGSAAR